MKKQITFESIKNNDVINAYVAKADLSLEAMGYTDHSFAHVGKCADTVKRILSALNYPSHDIDLRKAPYRLPRAPFASLRAIP